MWDYCEEISGFYKSVVPWVSSWVVVLLITVQIAIVFGAKVLEYVLNLCRGNYDFLERLPVPLLLYIISFLELEGIARLSQVSSRFEMICNSNALWENTVGNSCSTITPEMKELAQEMAWNQFFTVFSYSCNFKGGGRNKTLRTKKKKKGN
uniref:F-box domain-containing protein n=1 Tax=Strigops habroptila TaxID=2489341 RepID=A0A672V3B8_STRHB